MGDTISQFLQQLLQQLGQRLKQARLERDDSQKDFAFRIDVSIPTLHKMETGNPQVAMGTWAKALDILGCAADFEKLIVPKKSLAERFESHQKNAGRQRVKRSK